MIDDLKKKQDGIHDKDWIDGWNDSIDDLHAKGLLMVWQPIESAPKDGTQFLIRTERVGFAVVSHDPDDRYSKPCDLNPAGLSLSVYDGKHGPFPLRGDYPTHWMPTPPMPKGDA